MAWWDDLADVVTAVTKPVADVVEATTDWVSDLVDDAVDGAADFTQELLDDVDDAANSNLPPAVAGAVTFILGAVGGVVQGVADIVKSYVDLTVRGLGKVVAAVLRLDLPGILRALGDWMISAGALVVDFLRLTFGGAIVGGIVRQFERQSLRSFVSDLLDTTFKDDERGKLAARRAAGLEGGSPFGLLLNIWTHQCFVDTANTDVATWHREGLIDLYALAGGAGVNAAAVITLPRAEVKAVKADGTDDWLPALRWQITAYLKGEGIRLRLYPERDTIMRKKIKALIKALRSLGMRARVDGRDTRYGWINWRRRTREIGTRSELLFRDSQNSQTWGEVYLANANELGAAKDRECVFHLFSNFFAGGLFGRAFGRDLRESTDNNLQALPADAAQRDREDGYIAVVEGNEPAGWSPAGWLSLVAAGRASPMSCVVYHDQWPDLVFRTVPAHEIGHLLGLVHAHHSPKDIMYTIKDGQDTQLVDWSLAKYYYEREPSFSSVDARCAWRFIVDQLRCLLR